MEEKILFDGFDLETGQPRGSSVSPLEVGRGILERRRVGDWQPAPRSEEVKRGMPRDWGLVCCPNLDPDIVDALDPLVKKRHGDLYCYNGASDQITWARYLKEQGHSLPASSMYLLLVGGPEEISFDFERMLTPQHAVGRLDLPDAAAYERYVRALLAYEQDEESTGIRRLHVDFFAPDWDETEASCEQFARPLQQTVEQITREDFTAEGLFGEKATGKAVVARLAGYRETGAPALLFLASHGLEVEGDLRPRFQGSWVPQGTPGLGHVPSPQEVKDHCLTGDHFGSGDLSPYGSIVFNFSCFGGGLHEGFSLREWFLEGGSEPDDPQPMVSALGRGLLANPRPALAYISTLDQKTNVFSLLPDGLQPFEEWVTLVLSSGWSVGMACQILWEKGVTLLQGAYSRLEDMLSEGKTAQTLSEQDAWVLALNWFMADELDGFVIHGDPAVRLHDL